MNILLVNPPCRIPALIPLGLGYIANVLRQGGNEVSLMDLNVEKKTFAEIEKDSRLLKADLIGIGGLTTTYSFVKAFSSMAKSATPEAKVIAGNMVSTASPELLLNNSGVDICVIDEGEETVRELASRIKDFPDIENVKGVVFKKENRIIRTPARERIKDLDKLPFPAWDLFSMETYLNNPIENEYGRRSINISAVRGCPFQCIYCSRPFGSKVYMRSPASVISEIKELKQRYHVKFIDFSDDLFMVSGKWVEELCYKLVKERVGVGWGASGRVNLIDLSLLKKMKRAGCEILSYGFESGSQKMLDNMKKSARVEDAERAVNITRKAGITVVGSFMIGMIGETEETVSETVDFIKRTRLTLHRFFYTTPYPNTPLYETAKQMGRIPADEDAYVGSLGEMYNTLSVNLTEMTSAELKNLKERAEKAIRDNFSLRIRLEIATEEIRRVLSVFRKRMSDDGILPTLSWFLGKIKEKIFH